MKHTNLVIGKLYMLEYGTVNLWARHELGMLICDVQAGIPFMILEIGPIESEFDGNQRNMTCVALYEGFLGRLDLIHQSVIELSADCLETL